MSVRSHAFLLCVVFASATFSPAIARSQEAETSRLQRELDDLIEQRDMTQGWLDVTEEGRAFLVIYFGHTTAIPRDEFVDSLTARIIRGELTPDAAASLARQLGAQTRLAVPTLKAELDRLDEEILKLRNQLEWARVQGRREGEAIGGAGASPCDQALTGIFGKKSKLEHGVTPDADSQLRGLTACEGRRLSEPIFWWHLTERKQWVGNQSVYAGLYCGSFGNPALFTSTDDMMASITKVQEDRAEYCKGGADAYCGGILQIVTKDRKRPEDIPCPSN